MPAADPGSRVRLDRWLFFARVVKSRTLAQKLIESGAVRVDSMRVTAPDFRIAPGMVLTLNVHERLLVLRIVAPGARRGPAAEAQTLYQDLSPQLPRAPKTGMAAPAAKREKGSGRPTKKERRETDALRAHAARGSFKQ